MNYLTNAHIKKPFAMFTKARSFYSWPSLTYKLPGRRVYSLQHSRVTTQGLIIFLGGGSSCGCGGGRCGGQEGHDLLVTYWLTMSYQIRSSYYLVGLPQWLMTLPGRTVKQQSV